MSVKYMR